MDLAAGHIHKCGEMTSGVQAGVQFISSFAGTKFSPWKGGKAKLDGCCVEQAELAIERKFVVGSNSLGIWRRVR
jgi:hypothetical protein